MSDIPKELVYTSDDEWILVQDGKGTIGITDYAQSQLSDIVYLELPEVGDTFAAGDTFGVVESVKAAADLYMPVDGTVIEINEGLLDEPERVNQAPYESWMIKIEVSDPSQLDDLMDAEAYDAYIKSREGE